MKKIYILFSLFLILLYSCADNKTKTITEHENNFGGKLNFSISNKISTIVPAYLHDIASTQISSQVFEGLLKFNPKNLTIEKGIAKKWSVDTSGYVYTFELNDNVYFHNDPCFENEIGRKVTSDDVKYTIYFLATKSEKNKNFFGTIDKIKGAKEYYEASANGKPKIDIEGFKKIDDLKFTITLISKNFPLIEFLANPAAAIVPKEGIEKYGENCLIGCGPYKVSSLTEDNKTILVRNGLYFKQDKKENYLPYLDTINISYIKTARTKLKQLKEGNLSIASLIDNENATAFLADNIKDFEGKNPKYKMIGANVLNNNSLQNIMYGNIEGFYTNSYNYLDLSIVYFKR